MNKQIEEMANIVHDADAKIIYNMLKAQPDEFVGRALPRQVYIAKALYNAGYRKSTDVAAVAIDKFRDAIMDVFIDMCRGNDYNKVTLLQIGDAINAVYDKQIAELYESEGADDE